MRSIHDIELDAVRIDEFSLVLPARFRRKRADLELAAIRKALCDVLVLVGIKRPMRFGFRAGFSDVVSDEPDMMKAVVTERFVAVLVVEYRKADHAVRHQVRARRFTHALQAERLLVELGGFVCIRNGYGDMA